LVQFEGGLEGIVLNLEEDNVEEESILVLNPNAPYLEFNFLFLIS